MKLFNSKGMMLFPNPASKEKICKSKKILVIEECYCHNGHNLVCKKAIFNGFNGIIFKIKKDNQEGMVALSPVYGYKSRVCLDVELKEEEIWEIICPECNEPLPTFAKCSCGGDLVAMFAEKEKDFSDCLTICNRINCFNAEIHLGNEMIALSTIFDIK